MVGGEGRSCWGGPFPRLLGGWAEESPGMLAPTSSVLFTLSSVNDASLSLQSTCRLPATLESIEKRETNQAEPVGSESSRALTIMSTALGPVLPAALPTQGIWRLPQGHSGDQRGLSNTPRGPGLSQDTEGFHRTLTPRVGWWMLVPDNSLAQNGTGQPNRLIH